MNRRSNHPLPLFLSLVLAFTLLAGPLQAQELTREEAQWIDSDLLQSTIQPGAKMPTLGTRSNDGGSAPYCEGEIHLFGRLDGAPHFDVQPAASGAYISVVFSVAIYQSRGLVFCLDGPSGVDFDLYIDKWDPVMGWTLLAASTSGAPDETIVVGLSPGEYRARVYNYSGTGPYVLLIDGRLVDLKPAIG